jgi:beta-lactamase regulating signal transducer with metallopeptidase domain
MNMPLWFSNLLFWGVQVALLVIAAGVLPRLFRIREPKLLLGYWRVLLLIALLLPSVQPWHRLPSAAPILVVPDGSEVSFPVSAAPEAAHWQFSSMQTVAEGIGVTLLAGIALRLAFVVLGLVKLRRFRRTALPISLTARLAAILDETRTRVGVAAKFRISADVDSPVTFGFGSPIVLLPQQFLSMDAGFQSAIACHELLHVRRRDWVDHLLEEVIRAIFWFHPGIAWLISRARLAREQVVDLEVVGLTNARKTYLEALLEFTNSRGRIAAIPAPPFLAERQLVERIALMVKEVRMSRRKLMISSVVISCCLVMVIALSARSFPLKRGPLQSAPKTGVTGGVADGVSGSVAGEVSGGVNGGIAGGVSTRESSDEPNVDYSTIWTDTVKRGPMLRQVRGLGNLARAEGSSNLVARIVLPVVLMADLKLNQTATVDTGKGLVKGQVTAINAASSDETRSVYITLDGPPPAGVGLDTPVDGTVDIEKLDNVLQVGRPVDAAANSNGSIYKVVNDGTEAQRVNVKYGRSSVRTIEILDGLQPGDKVILSDMSEVEKADRVHLTDTQHLRKQ